jgi:hypothetical protein
MGQSKKTKTPIYVCENRTLGTDHTVIGEIVARRWSLFDQATCRSLGVRYEDCRDMVTKAIELLPRISV